MTHVVHLTSVHYPFDPRIFHKELRSLSEAGYQTTLVAHHEESLTRDGIRIVSIGEANSRAERWKNLYRFYTTAVNLGADVYHFHDPELLPVGVALSARTDAAVIYDIHEDYADAIRVREWIPDQFKPLLARGFPAIQSVFATQFDAIVTADESTWEKMRNRGHDPVVALRNVPRIGDIDLGRGDIERGHDLVLAYVGGLDRERGLMRMLKLTARLRQEGVDAGLWLIGPFQDEEIEREARAYMQHQSITEHVTLFGYVDYDDIFGYLQHADIGLLLVDRERFKRNVPTKLFEYMYAGLPVVATRAKSLHSYLDSSYARIVPENDTAEQATIVMEAFTDPDVCRTMGTTAHDIVSSKYSWEREQKKLLDLYNKII